MATKVKVRAKEVQAVRNFVCIISTVAYPCFSGSSFIKCLSKRMMYFKEFVGENQKKLYFRIAYYLCGIYLRLLDVFLSTRISASKCGMYCMNNTKNIV